MSWLQSSLTFVDFEGSVDAGIVEYGLVHLVDGQILDATTRLCRPTGRMREADIALHGLAPDRLATEASFAEEYVRFADLRKRGPLAAHFAAAEQSMLRAVWPYAGQVPDFSRPGELTAEWGPWLDTGRLYPQLRPELGAARLGDLVAATGLQEKLDAVAERWCPPTRRRYHAALYDALAGALLLLKLAEDSHFAVRSLPWMLMMSTLDHAKREGMQQGELF